MKKSIYLFLTFLLCLFVLLGCTETETPASVPCSHNYTETIVAQPTYTTQGTKKFTCSLCNDSYTEAFSKTTYKSTEIFAMTEKSVGEIMTYDKYRNQQGIASCFVYSSDGKIITNYHVIEGACSAEVKLNGETYSVAKVLGYDIDIDVAILQIYASNLPALPINYETPLTGSTVYAFGSSRGMTATFSNGIITHAQRDVDGVVHVQHNAAISPGNSGGPLINEYGEVIGINAWTLLESQNLNFAIFATELNYVNTNISLTIQQVCDLEWDPYQMLVDYIKENGDYSSSNGTYFLYLGSSYSSDQTEYARVMLYSTTYDEISYSLIMPDYDMDFYFYIDEADGIYEYWFWDNEYDYAITGSVYARTFHSTYTLTHSQSFDLPTSLISSFRNIASISLDILCTHMGDDLSSIGLKPSDLGFINYN